MADEKVSLLVLGSPVISPKAPRKILRPSLDERLGAKSLGRSPQPTQSHASSKDDFFKSIPLSKATQMKAVRRGAIPGEGIGSPRRGRSVLSDGGRRGRSPVEWEGQQHWSEVK